MQLSAEEAFPRYFSILKGESLPVYLEIKRVPVTIELNASSERLWEAHGEALGAFRDRGPGGGSVYPSLLDLKVELAKRMLHDCGLCERRCGADRTVDEGYCGVRSARVASKFVHLGEEPELVPSYTIFFSGCTFDCVFCQNWDISQRETGSFVEPGRLASDIGRKDGAVRNVNWVGGEPTPDLPYILEVLAACEAGLPQIWNSNMYMSPGTMGLLDGVIDLYLADFKYGNDACAKRLSDAEDYFPVVSRNHRLANGQCEMIVRHLVMPGHVECCSKPVMEWLADTLDTKRVRVNVMDQYRPQYRADEFEELRRGLTRGEFLEARRHAESLGLSLVD